MNIVARARVCAHLLTVAAVCALGDATRIRSLALSACAAHPRQLSHLLVSPPQCRPALFLRACAIDGPRPPLPLGYQPHNEYVRAHPLSPATRSICVLAGLLSPVLPRHCFPPHYWYPALRERVRTIQAARRFFLRRKPVHSARTSCHQFLTLVSS